MAVTGYEEAMGLLDVLDAGMPMSPQERKEFVSSLRSAFTGLHSKLLARDLMPPRPPAESQEPGHFDAEPLTWVCGMGNADHPIRHAVRTAVVGDTECWAICGRPVKQPQAVDRNDGSWAVCAACDRLDTEERARLEAPSPSTTTCTTCAGTGDVPDKPYGIERCATCLGIGRVGVERNALPIGWVWSTASKEARDGTMHAVRGPHDRGPARTLCGKFFPDALRALEGPSETACAACRGHVARGTYLPWKGPRASPKPKLSAADVVDAIARGDVKLDFQPHRNHKGVTRFEVTFRDGGPRADGGASVPVYPAWLTSAAAEAVARNAPGVRVTEEPGGAYTNDFRGAPPSDPHLLDRSTARSPAWDRVEKALADLVLACDGRSETPTILGVLGTIEACGVTTDSLDEREAYAARLVGATRAMRADRAHDGRPDGLPITPAQAVALVQGALGDG